VAQQIIERHSESLLPAHAIQTINRISLKANIALAEVCAANLYSNLRLGATPVSTACGSGRVLLNVATRPLPQAVLTLTLGLVVADKRKPL
jgi:hypothetical protein